MVTILVVYSINSDSVYDWASIVAYSTIPDDFDQQVASFRDKQFRRKLEVKFHFVDEFYKNPEINLPEGFNNIDNLFNSIRDDHEKWLKSLPDYADSSERS